MDITFTQFKKNVEKNNIKYKTEPVKKDSNCLGGRYTTNIKVQSSLFDVAPSTAIKLWWKTLNGKSANACYSLIKNKWNDFEYITKYADTKTINSNFTEVKALLLAVSAYLGFSRDDLNKYGRISQEARNELIPVGQKKPGYQRDYFDAASPAVHMFLTIIKGKQSKTTNKSPTKNKKSKKVSSKTQTTKKTKNIIQHVKTNRKMLNCNGVGAPHVIAAHANGSI